jgi:hypothetical protein
VDLPATVFILARIPEGGASEERMALYAVDGPKGHRTPVFRSIRTASDFLTRAQQLGHPVRFDYLFRADAARLDSDFPEYQVVLDPVADDLYAGSP